MNIRISQLALIFGVLTAPAFAAPVLQLLPLGGAISGPAGATIGWGFTLMNSTNFLEVNQSDFCSGPIASPCANTLGTFTDFIGPNFIVVGPSPESSSVSQSFDALAQLGIGKFAINPGALPGTTLSGKIVVTYSLFSVSPNDPHFDPAKNLLSIGNQLTANASVSVPGSAVPEPASVFLIGLGLTILASCRKRLFHGEI